MQRILWIVAAAALAGCGEPEEPATPAAPRPARRAVPAAPAGETAPPVRYGAAGVGSGGGSTAVSSEVRRQLQRLRQSHDRDTLKECLDWFRGNDQAALFLASILADPEHDLLPEAIRVAGETGGARQRSLLEELVRKGAGPVQEQALKAADKIEAWPLEDLVAFLESGERHVLLGALDVVAMREVRPMREIFELLGHRDLEVREAAVRAVPEELTEADRATLVGMLQIVEATTARYVMRALGRSKIDGRIEAVLQEKLQDPERETRITALDLLATKGAPLADPRAVWSPSARAPMDDLEESHALYCLERTGSFDTAQILVTLPRLGPLPRYYAARCLLKERRRDGVSILLDLLETVDDRTDSVEEEHAADRALAIGVRRLLGKVAGTGPFTTIAAWRTWLDEVASLPNIALPPAPEALL